MAIHDKAGLDDSDSNSYRRISIRCINWQYLLAVDRRLSFIFGVIPYGHALAVVSLMSLALLVYSHKNPGSKWVYILAFWACLVLELLARTRSSLVLTVIFGVGYVL